jgi:hypothetical protein
MKSKDHRRDAKGTPEKKFSSEEKIPETRT